MLDNSGLLAWVANVAILISMITVIISGQHIVKMKRFFEILFRCLAVLSLPPFTHLVI